jgi:NAD(P)-dependent dehydrogenase (short-subunit alcohol dehydrogenase family)
VTDGPARRALITGGSSGIGLAVGRTLVARGYEVTLNARRGGPLTEAAASIGARFVVGDCADEADADTVVWLDTLDPAVVLPEVELRAATVGPFAPELLVPEAARTLGRTGAP